ncbi:MAG: hypothetical protein EXR69_15050 [Myxococcales bacterium]|nr:hypothetical protein [Myxococcales bacterium]
MRIGVICSAHGFGHVGRQLATAEELVRCGHEVVLITAAPAGLIRAGARVEVVTRSVDVGIAQSDSVTEDTEATRALWLAAVGRIDELAEDLRGLDGAVVDIAPTGLEACRRAGVPALAVGNFDWAWVYERYTALAEFAPQMREWHAAHPAMALSPGPGLTGFRSVTDVRTPLARRASPVRIDPPSGFSVVLVAFGGLGLANLADRLPQIPGVLWLVTPPQGRIVRADIHYVDDVPFPALLAGADLVLTKPGYGVLAEAQVAGVKLCWIARGVFPEAGYLETVMLARGDLPVGADVSAAVQRALALPDPPAVATTAATEVAAAVLSHAISGARRRRSG